MTDVLDRVRAVAMQLPGAEERDGAFIVAGQPFARVDGARLSCVGADGWTDMALDEGADWQLVEDRVARAWELTAPQGLLEAGGR